MADDLTPGFGPWTKPVVPLDAEGDWPGYWRTAGCVGAEEMQGIFNSPPAFRVGDYGRATGMGRPRLLNGMHLGATRRRGESIPLDWVPMPDGRLMRSPRALVYGDGGPAVFLASVGYARDASPDATARFARGVADPPPGWVAGLWVGDYEADSPTTGRIVTGLYGAAGMPQGINQYGGWVLDVLPLDARLKRLFAVACYSHAESWLTHVRVDPLDGGRPDGGVDLDVARMIADREMPPLTVHPTAANVVGPYCHWAALLFHWAAWLFRGVHTGVQWSAQMPPQYAARVAGEAAAVAGVIYPSVLGVNPGVTFWADYSALPWSGGRHRLTPTAVRWMQGYTLEGFVGPDTDLPPEAFTTAAVALAREVYARRSFDLLPVLADALEDAGVGPTHTAPLRDPLYVRAADRGEWTVDRLRGHATRPRRFPDFVAE